METTDEAVIQVEERRVGVAAPTTFETYRWLILAMVWLSYLITFVDRLIWTSVGTVASGSYGLSLAALGVFVTAFYAGYVISQALTGFLSDSIGPRLMLSVALVSLGLLTFAFGSTTTIAMGLILQGLMGLAAGADYAAGVKLIVSWFPVQQRGRAMGLFMTATSLGVVLTNALAPQALQLMAWPSIYHIAGIFTGALGVLCYLLLRDNPNGATLALPNWRDFQTVMISRQFIFLVLAGAGGVWGTWGYAIWASALMTRGLHFSAMAAGGIVAVFGVAAAVGKPLIGLLSDLLGGRRKMLVMVDLFAFALLLLLTGTLETEAQFWIMAPLLGLTAFAYSPLSNTMVAEAGGNAAASASGLSAATGSVGTVIVPLVVGAVFQATGSYEAAFSILAVGPLVGGLCMIAVRDISVEQDRRKSDREIHISSAVDNFIRRIVAQWQADLLSLNAANLCKVTRRCCASFICASPGIVGGRFAGGGVFPPPLLDEGPLWFADLIAAYHT